MSWLGKLLATVVGVALMVVALLFSILVVAVVAGVVVVAFVSYVWSARSARHTTRRGTAEGERTRHETG